MLHYIKQFFEKMDITETKKTDQDTDQDKEKFWFTDSIYGLGGHSLLGMTMNAVCLLACYMADNFMVI